MSHDGTQQIVYLNHKPDHLADRKQTRIELRALKDALPLCSASSTPAPPLGLSLRRISAYCIGDRINLKSLAKHLMKDDEFASRTAIHFGECLSTVLKFEADSKDDCEVLKSNRLSERDYYQVRNSDHNHRNAYGPRNTNLKNNCQIESNNVDDVRFEYSVSDYTHQMNEMDTNNLRSRIGNLDKNGYPITPGNNHENTNSLNQHMNNSVYDLKNYNVDDFSENGTLKNNEDNLNQESQGPISDSHQMFAQENAVTNGNRLDSDSSYQRLVEKKRRYENPLNADSFYQQSMEWKRRHENSLNSKNLYQQSIERKRRFENFDDGKISYDKHNFNIDPYNSDKNRRNSSKDHKYHQRSMFSEINLFVFDYGVIVGWGCSEKHDAHILKYLKPFIEGPHSLENVETEHFSYGLIEDTPRIANDILYLKNDTLYDKIIISNPIAQSVKLDYFEKIIDSTIETVKNLPEEIESMGKVGSSRADVLRNVGKLHRLRFNLNLISSILDDPEVLWHHPEYNTLYQCLHHYLDIRSRTAVLNQRFDVIQGILEILSDNISTRNSESLEKTIMLLNVGSIILGTLQLGLMWLIYMK